MSSDIVLDHALAKDGYFYYTTSKDFHRVWKRGNPINWYAATNPREYFAEGITAFLLQDLSGRTDDGRQIDREGLAQRILFSILLSDQSFLTQNSRPSAVIELSSRDLPKTMLAERIYSLRERCFWRIRISINNEGTLCSVPSFSILSNA